MKPLYVGIHEAKTQFSKYVKRAEAGQETVVTLHDKPVAKIVPYTPAKIQRKPGLLSGQITVKPGFDEPVPGFEIFGQ